MNYYGLVLVSNPTAQRAAMVRRCMESLAKTDVRGISCVLQITYKYSVYLPFEEYAKILWSTFRVTCLPDEVLQVSGQGPLSTMSANHLLGGDDLITHLVFMYDDFIYNPAWLRQLDTLIARHPDARAWSVYRSSYTRHHRILVRDANGDCLMSMHDGVGCVTKQEWMDYREQHQHALDFSVPPTFNGGGCTFDCHINYARPGERWATGKDYWENLGVHSFLGRADMAVDFVGE